MPRLAYLLAVALCAGCSDSTTPVPSPVGQWTVTAVNSQPVPAPTPSGRTLFHGTLALTATGVGSVRTCSGATGAELESLDSLAWQETAAGLRFTYRQAVPPDTATVSGETMNWHAKIVEPLLSTSDWDLMRVSTDPSGTASCP